ncbi:unnamed protein product [Rotaria sordida]|uniref:Uncharacterized protein n=1 Tax=Rotaria sordida TaxID=392033 RepID=A0A819DK33_9BILA|nr:unnamed protein product [Rotaria sordida]CAF1447281.1 unnamed protein product [Rotaria sordida]CAF3729779.1 unnamed protein product [Rotaria sordida]CAF3825079.1 unnamed protein product [Rotaria sordida]CAF4230592.1 unnamed protein product [Rotaria sordida]
MDGLNAKSQEETQEEIMPLRTFSSRRQHQKLQFAEEKEQQEKSPSSLKSSIRTTRLLSIYDPSLQLPGAKLLQLQQLHNQFTQNNDLSISEEITDELLDKIPFKIEIIPERRDDFIEQESSLTKNRRHHKEPLEIPKVIPSGLSEERRLEIIEEILKNLNKKNLLDDIRRADAIPFRLPKNNQLQKKVAERIRDLTGSEIVMLNDHVYMKNLCQRIDEEYKKELEEKLKRLESNEKRRLLFENIFSI